MNWNDWRHRIDERTLTIGIVGLGYVGLPLACEFARAGFIVWGVDLRADRVAQILDGTCPIEGDEPGLAELLHHVVTTGRLHASTNYADLADADVITLNVDTPVGVDHLPRYDALRSACAALGPVLKRDALVIVESTVSPGTTEGLVRMTLETSSGLRCGIDFALGACPERVMPGRLLANLRGVSRVCGGASPETAHAMTHLYRTIVPHADLDATDIITAELVKTVENAYRDVNIAFANETALLCEQVGGNVWAVRDLVNKSPGRTMLLPGAGVGGHCIPKDPWLLIAGHASSAKLIPAARAVNDAMPVHIAALALRTANRDQPRILLLGYTYLENSDDVRASPTERTAAALRASGADVRIHDPHVPEYAGHTISETAVECDVVVLMVRHAAYESIDWGSLAAVVAQPPRIVDGRGFLDKAKLRALGWRCVELGVGGEP